MNLYQVAEEIARRLASIFLRGRGRPSAGLRRHREVPGRPALARPASCSTSTSTATTAPASAPAIRPAGPASSPALMHLFATITAEQVLERGKTAYRVATAEPDAARADGELDSGRAIADRVRCDMTLPRYPSLYQINTRVWLTELSRDAGPAGDAGRHSGRRTRSPGGDGLRLGLVAERLADRRGRAARSRAATRSGGRNSRRRCRTCARRTSPAPASRSPATRCIASLGGDAALARLRERLRQRGLRLMLDFVPNHMALDHPWVEDHPEYLHRAARSSTWPARRRTTPGSSASSGDLLLAHGRDPYFPGWPDTLQLNYGNPATQEAMIGELLKIAGQCDGVRCDMAMLVLPDVFERTWGIRAAAVLAGGDPARARAGPGLLLHGRGLLGPGMDAAAAGLRLRLRQAALRPPPRRARPAGARALPRRASTTRTSWPASWRTTTSRGPPRRSRPDVHEAAAVITFLVAGPALLPPGPVRGPEEAHLAAPRAAARTSPSTRSSSAFYDRLLAVLRQPVVRDGRWQLLECVPAWDGNWTSDCFIAFAWQGPGDERLLGRRELRREPEPVLRPAAVRGPRRQDMAVAGPPRGSDL